MEVTTKQVLSFVNSDFVLSHIIVYISCIYMCMYVSIYIYEEKNYFIGWILVSR